MSLISCSRCSRQMESDGKKLLCDLCVMVLTSKWESLPFAQKIKSFQATIEETTKQIEMFYNAAR